MSITKLAYNGSSKIIKNLVNTVNALIDSGGGGGGGSTVTYTPVLTSGTKTGEISIDGTSQDMYAPTPQTYTAGDGIEITGSTISLEYFSVVNGAINVTFDDGN